MHDDSSTRSPLTAREREVLRLIAAGMSTRQIASTLGISFKTVVTHRTRLMEKLDVHNVAEVTRYALLHQQDGFEYREREARERELLDAVREAEKTYRAAAADQKQVLLAAKSGELKGDEDGQQVLYRAAQAEREAIEKYAEALKAFTKLIFNGPPPPQSGWRGGIALRDQESRSPAPRLRPPTTKS
jgi:DNA-binding CsgD family transcriptional regulator